LRPHSAEMIIKTKSAIFVVLAWAAILVAGARAATTPPVYISPPRFRRILSYISDAWGTLTRSTGECRAVEDPKNPQNAVLYFPADYSIPASIRHSLAGCSLRIERLPAVIHQLGQLDEHQINPHGLLYLPQPYVVPGGMFNEMYGWDSYFILRGLLSDGRIALARGIVENFYFEIDHYGAILNANRGYTLERSQPPFLTAMVRAVYEAELSRGQQDRAWLERAYPYGEKEYNFWTHGRHLAGTTGLSRYNAFGSGPVPELGAASNTYYRGVTSYFLFHPQAASDYLASEYLAGSASLDPPPNLAGALFPVYICEPKIPGSNVLSTIAGNGCALVGAAGLSAAFYKGDRSIRESGFDITFKFGPFGAGTPDYAPAGLNSLVYNEARNLAWISKTLGRNQEAAEWGQRARKLRAAMDKYLWNSSRGLYFDFNFTTGKQSDYVYASTFYPLWAGAASRAQAAAVEKDSVLLDEPGGIVMSRNRSGAQWDYPYGWAPIQLIAVDGLRKYGYNAEADSIAENFLSMVNQNFLRDGTIREKYNVVTRSDEVTVRVGYTQNQVGFGWTNGVFVTLFDQLPAAWRKQAME
jgi:alpha,alpha-trehalase